MSWFGLAIVFLSFGLYALFQIMCGSYYKYQNLKDRYKAEWALVTGASTGAQTACLNVQYSFWEFKAPHGYSWSPDLYSFHLLNVDETVGSTAGCIVMQQCCWAWQQARQALPLVISSA